MQLSLSSVVEEFKVAKCRAAILLRRSTEDNVRDAGVTTRAGCKWVSDTSMTQAESMLKLKGHHRQPLYGAPLKSTPFQQWAKVDPKQRKDMVQAEVQKLKEEGRVSRAAEMGS